jgi:penicillin-binding protein 1A
MRFVRRVVVVLVCVAGAAALALWAAQPYLEQRVSGYIAEAGAAAGVTIGAVHFAWNDPVRLERVIVDRPDTGRVQVERAEVRWDLAGGRDPRAHVRGFDLRGVRMQRGPLTMELSETAFDVVSWEVRDGEERLRLRQIPSGGEFEARWRTRARTPDIGLTLSRFDLASARVRWSGDDVLQPGAWTGNVGVSSAGPELTLRGDAAAEGVRIKLPPSFGGQAGEFGAPVAVHLVWEAIRSDRSIDVRELDADLGGLVIEARGRVDGLGPDAVIEARVSAHTDLGAAFQATGIRLPVSMDVAPTDRLGTASGELAIRGPLWRPAELTLTPELRFESTPGGIEKLQFLNRPFRYEPPGSGASIVVRAGEPDFISIAAVPPLFLDALLLSEDAGFYGHPGVDVAEMRAAWADNVERGTLARGGSTITQQLVKNLFLSREKSYGRKMEEAALALLVDAALSKRRILEIYLNVIEWGPGLYGLAPAARHYFGKAPAALTPKEIAFLVCLIPSPVRYHQAHSAGRAGPEMEQLMANLLAKLRSVEAIGEEDYAAALDEALRFAPEGAAASVS